MFKLVCKIVQIVRLLKKSHLGDMSSDILMYKMRSFTSDQCWTSSLQYLVHSIDLSNSECCFHSFT